MIKGIFETHLEVSNLNESIKFYQETLGLSLERYETDRKRAFFVFGKDEKSMISIVQSDKVNIRHFAFRVDYKDLHNMIPFLIERKIEIVPGWDGASIEEPVVFPWLATASVYFNDLDGNRLEFICELPHKPIPDYKKVIIKLSEWENLQK
jgi:lactoylglutathione lyase